MRYYEINEDIGRRGFLGALGLGALGTSIFKPGTPTSDEKAAGVATTQSQNKNAPTAAPAVKPVIPKYSSEQLKRYMLDYAKKALPQNQVIPFMAQVAHESHNFRSLEENLNYSPQLLTKRYPKLFTAQQAEYAVSHPLRDQIIANTIYANRMGNSDYKSGDGYKYRGRGYIQLTGKENYEKMGRSLNIDLVNNPDLASRPDYAAQIAVHYWKTRVANKVNTGNIAQVTKKIAGSSKQGIESRREKLKQYQRELSKKK